MKTPDIQKLVMLAIGIAVIFAAGKYVNNPAPATPLTVGQAELLATDHNNVIQADEAAGMTPEQAEASWEGKTITK